MRLSRDLVGGLGKVLSDRPVTKENGGLFAHFFLFEKNLKKIEKVSKKVLTKWNESGIISELPQKKAAKNRRTSASA